MIVIPNFETKKELYDFLVTNKDSLISQKFAAIKYADGFCADAPVFKLRTIDKSSDEDNSNKTELQVKAVINTTGILDSHSDVHIKGIWNKSLKENKRIMHLQEHKSNEFSKIISSGDDLKASVKTYTWKELGYDAKGETQALVFDSTVKQSRNPYMFDQYKNGYVDNHSVGMQYVKLALAIADEEYLAENALWKEHIGGIVNADKAEKQGYFWVVSEAKIIEGSSVPNGSNPVTPTLNIKNEVGVEDARMLAMKSFLGIKQ